MILAFNRRFMAFDRHMNLVLGDAEEFRKLAPKKGRSEEEVCCPCAVSAVFLHSGFVRMQGYSESPQMTCIDLSTTCLSF